MMMMMMMMMMKLYFSTEDLDNVALLKGDVTLGAMLRVNDYKDQSGRPCELLVQIKWNYVAIVYDDDAYGRQAATRLRALAQDRHICVPLFEALPLDHTSEVFDDRVKVITQQVTASTESDSRVKGIVFIGGAVTAKEFVERVDRSFVRFIFSEGLGLQGSVLKDVTRGKGALTASPPYLPLPEFKVYWSEMWNNRYFGTA
nr:hypothetical protein BaRGS_006402 [Batillaria attramentaria]